MKAGFELWPPKAWLEVPTPVYAILGATAFAIVTAFSMPHWNGRSVSVSISAHGISVSFDLVKQDRLEVVHGRNELPQVEDTFAERWKFENMAEMTLPKARVVEDTQMQGSSPSETIIAKAPASKRPKAFGYYYEIVRVQGDAFEGELKIYKRPCGPFQMPLACYYPQRERWKLPVYRE